MPKIDYNKHVWEGWRVIDFINELKPQLEMIMLGTSWKKPISTREELAKWCTENQPYYKKLIPDVVNYFCSIYNIH